MTPVVLVCGIPTEPPVSKIIRELLALQAQVVVFNQRQFENAALEFSVDDGSISGIFSFYDSGYKLENFTGVYSRLMDYRSIPELSHELPSSERISRCARIHEVLDEWMEVTAARVVNRSSAMGSNASKPYQAQLIRRCGFNIPETLITNLPEAVLEFNGKHKKIIFKSMSGVRSIVKVFDERDKERLSQIRWCPVQFQQFIDGLNVRVHVVGDKVIPTAVYSDATDYRYSSMQTGASAKLVPYGLDNDIADKCVNLTQSLGLAFSGIDLKFADDGRVFCFEVNPNPGYSYFEDMSGQPIARSVGEYLVSGKAA